MTPHLVIEVDGWWVGVLCVGPSFIWPSRQRVIPPDAVVTCFLEACRRAHSR